MTETPQIAAFVSGKLELLHEDHDSSEAVLALPLNRLIVRMVKVPVEKRDDPVSVAEPLLQAMSPYPDEPLKIGCEIVRETDGELLVLAAALPESSADDIAEALDAEKLEVTRVDALFLGELRRFWQDIGVSDGGRRLLRIKSPDCMTLVVLDGDLPVSIRAVAEGADLRREEMLTLLEAEDFGGARDLKETLDFASDVRAAMSGVGERSLEEGALNALPGSWGEVLEESRFKAKLLRRVCASGGVWAFLMAALFGVPVVFGMLENHQNALRKDHSRQYSEVAKIKEKVELVRKYSDHSRGALEIMKAVSDRLPEGVELDSWTFHDAEGVKISGTAEEDLLVYKLKKALETLTISEDSEELLFKTVNMGNLSASRGRQRFTIELGYVAEEEE